MPIKYDEKPGTILLCNYDIGRPVPPEMVKLRPVVVVSIRRRKCANLLTVVPLSTSEPVPLESYQCQIVLDVPLPGFLVTHCWAKADMLATVSFTRLEMFRTSRGPDGQRKYLTRRVSDAQLAEIRTCMRIFLGI